MINNNRFLFLVKILRKVMKNILKNYKVQGKRSFLESRKNIYQKEFEKSYLYSFVKIIAVRIMSVREMFV